MEIKNLGIFCGSSSPNSASIFNNVKCFLEELLRKNDYTIIYGGAKIGIMGELANIALKNGRSVYGVMPGFLKDREVDHEGLTTFELHDTMHSRKQRMYELSDGFLILPGGFGTLDEFFEILTWRQLYLHDKPIYLYNCNGFYDYLILHIKKMSDSGLISASDKNLVKVINSAQDMH